SNNKPDVQEARPNAGLLWWVRGWSPVVHGSAPPRGVRSTPEPKFPPALERYIDHAIITHVMLHTAARWAHGMAADEAEVIHWLSCMPNGTVAEKPIQQVLPELLHSALLDLIAAAGAVRRPGAAAITVRSLWRPVPGHQAAWIRGGPNAGGN